MNQFFIRFWMLVSLFSMQLFFAQNYSNGLSDGILVVNSKETPVKIFASTDLGRFKNFPEKGVKNALVIVNTTNFEPGDTQKNLYNEAIIEKYQNAGFQFLDKNFKPISVNMQNAVNAKYLLNTSDKITTNENVELRTKFKIWDPSTGIHLGPITLHYYSLMFILAFGFGFLIMSKIFKIDHVNAKYLDPLFTWTIVGTILGARLGHVIFYEPQLFKQDFWSIFLPIKTKPEFKFTGFSGLASHGAAIMLILTTLYYSLKIIKKNPFWVYDRLAVVVPLGGAFVRMGNFFNSEIIGKPAEQNSPFAILFPQMSNEYGLTIPRLPTQLFEATGYVLLFVLLWFIYRYTRKKYQQGWIFGLFFIILWLIRFFIEFLKEPQGDEKITWGILNTGQILSIPFIIAGIVIMIVSSKFKITEDENKKLE